MNFDDEIQISPFMLWKSGILANIYSYTDRLERCKTHVLSIECGIMKFNDAKTKPGRQQRTFQVV